MALLMRGIEAPKGKITPRFGLVIIDMAPSVRRGIVSCNGTVEAGIEKTIAVIHCARSFCLPIALIEGTIEMKTIAEITEAAGPAATLIRKPKTSAFSNPAFEDFLAQEGIQTLILTGFNMAVCVLDTAHDALIKKFNVATSPELLFGFRAYNAAIGKLARWGALAFYRFHTDFYRTTDQLMEAMQQSVPRNIPQPVHPLQSA